jgi:hypothetical protein
MTHHKLREEKLCLNCGNVVEDRYCGHCGQENINFNDSAIHLVIHYVQDLFHYDGKLWTTLKTLMRRPGHAALEYMEGKRRKFLDPIRFYIFTSTVFFLVLFFLVGDTIQVTSKSKPDGIRHRISFLQTEKQLRTGSPDTLQINALLQSLQDSLGRDSSAANDANDHDVEIDFFGDMQDTTGDQGWFEQYYNQRMEKKREEMKEKYGDNQVKASTAILDELLHTLPQLFFLSLPFFALFLQVLYIGSNRRRYVEHFIFSIYHYAYLFSAFLVLMLIMWSLGKINIEIPEMIILTLVLFWIFYPMIYLYLSMRRFYLDRGWKLILRFLILLFLFVVCILILTYVVALFTILF